MFQNGFRKIHRLAASLAGKFSLHGDVVRI